MRVLKHLDELVARHPVLAACRDDIEAAFKMIVECYSRDGKLLVCGNGGSAADAEHIAGELMKGFLSPRPLPRELQDRLRAANPELGPILAEKLQASLPVINLAGGMALATAFGNDVSPELAFAQAANGYGRSGDVLLGLSTSGNALNVRAALSVARAVGMKTIGLTGKGGGRMAELCDILIDVPATRTFVVQELHLPVYHCLCAMVEGHFFP
jgi:D-sedoheptulose 7-phosphate isomerase